MGKSDDLTMDMLEPGELEEIREALEEKLVELLTARGFDATGGLAALSAAEAKRAAALEAAHRVQQAASIAASAAAVAATDQRARAAIAARRPVSSRE